MGEITENSIDATSSLKLLPILKYGYSVTETKMTFTFTVHLKFIKNTVIED